MTFGSLFSGYGGFDAALEDVGMKSVWQVEIDKDANKVLQKRYPQVKRFNDVRDFRLSSDVVRPDGICAGWPCQGNSVAGKRAGMADGRSGLWGEVKRILSEFTPDWFLGENVPGILSVNGGNDWLTVLRDLAELGYGFAYRILDAQWFGVAQRRRRVFVVGCLGDWRRAAEILFESDCLPWHPAPSREARQSAAASLTGGSASGSGVNRPGRRREDDVNLALCLNGKNGKRYDGELESFVVGTLSAHAKEHGHAMTTQQAAESGQLIAHTLKAEGHDASEDGTGRGVPLVPYQCQGSNVGPMGTLRSGNGNETGGVPFIAFDTTQITSPGNYSNPKEGDPCHPLASGQHAPAVAFQTSQSGVRQSESHPTLDSSNGSRRYNGVVNATGVRRLMPIECLRLQGMPDDWLDDCGPSDSAKYRLIGNAVAKPCVEWIGRRLIEAT